MGSTTGGVHSDLESNFDVLTKHLEALSKPDDALALKFDEKEFVITQVSRGLFGFLTAPKWSDQDLSQSMKVVLSYNLMRATELINEISVDPNEIEKLKHIQNKAAIVKKWLEKVQGLKIADQQKAEKESEEADKLAKVNLASEKSKVANDRATEALAFKTILNTFGTPFVPGPYIPTAPSLSGFSNFKSKRVPDSKSEAKPEAVPQIPTKPNTDNPRFIKMNGGISSTEIEIKHRGLNKTGRVLELAQSEPQTAKVIKVQSKLAPAPAPVVAKEDDRPKKEEQKKVLSTKAIEVRQKLRDRTKSETFNQKDLMQSFASELTAATITSNIDPEKIEIQEETRRQRRSSIAISSALSAAIAFRATEVETEVEKEPEPMDIAQTVLSGTSPAPASLVEVAPKPISTSNFNVVAPTAAMKKPLDPATAESWEKSQRELRDSTIRLNASVRRVSIQG